MVTKVSQAFPPLAMFQESCPPPAEIFGAMLRETSDLSVACFHRKNEGIAAHQYADVAGIRHRTRVLLSEDPLREAREVTGSKIIPLFIDSAIDPELRERFFQNPDLAYFVDHQYTMVPNHESRVLHTIGTTRHGLETLGEWRGGWNIEGAERKRARGIEQAQGPVFTYLELRRLLHPQKFRKVILHGLGPSGTNISQACVEYASQRHLPQSAVTIHERGVEPRAYAEIAAQEVGDGVLPLHMECAVYYEMRRLFSERPKEMVFADHHYMNLDDMQLATRRGSWGVLQEHTPLRLASHPSPLPLMKKWLDEGLAEYVKAPSNSAAAEMVASSAADICITTDSGRRLSELEQVHLFGTPQMIFTIGTPLTEKDLREYRA